MLPKKKAPRNRTISVDKKEYRELKKRLLFSKRTKKKFRLEEILDKTIIGDTFALLPLIPDESFDLIILDPPYNLDKNFHGFKFHSMNDLTYYNYLKKWFPEVVKKLKSEGSLYLCGDWKNTAILHRIMSDYLHVKNRITWQREKGRGAKKNWKNAMEDIWFGTKDEKNYYFDVEAVKLKRRVRAPYRRNGLPKDWQEEEEGNFRMTYPSNFWDDISIPYWSMPENTEHPTQKAEKLIAKLILASSPQDGIVFDPFLGSGTTSVVAKKLGRHYVGIEINEEYGIWAEKRLRQADEERSIQGYVDGIFWERNSQREQLKAKKTKGIKRGESKKSKV